MPQAANSKTNFMLQQLRQYGIDIRMTKLHKRRKNTNIYVHTYMVKWSTEHKNNSVGKKKITFPTNSAEKIEYLSVKIQMHSHL
jgi:hypothetical protein